MERVKLIFKGATVPQNLLRQQLKINLKAELILIHLFTNVTSTNDYSNYFALYSI